MRKLIVFLMFSLFLLTALRVVRAGEPGMFSTQMSRPTPTVRRLVETPVDQSYCLVRITGKYPRCFVEPGKVYPVLSWPRNVVQLQTDEEISAEMASGILLLTELLYPAIDPPAEAQFWQKRRLAPAEEW